MICPLVPLACGVGAGRPTKPAGGCGLGCGEIAGLRLAGGRIAAHQVWAIEQAERAVQMRADQHAAFGQREIAAARAGFRIQRLKRGNPLLARERAEIDAWNGRRPLCCPNQSPGGGKESVGGRWRQKGDFNFDL